jgi:hypothetical protein
VAALQCAKNSDAWAKLPSIDGGPFSHIASLTVENDGMRDSSRFGELDYRGPRRFFE